MNVPDQEEVRRYAQSVLQRLETSPGSLTKHELKLGAKFKASDAKIKKIGGDCDELRRQIQQLQSMLSVAELQLEHERGRCQGVLDYLVDLHFDELSTAAGQEVASEVATASVHSIEDAKAKTNLREEQAAAEAAAQPVAEAVDRYPNP